MAKTTFKNDMEVTGDLTVGGAITAGAGAVPAGTPVAKINDPSGGATTDSQARTAINAIIDALEAFGISAST